jgi:hypothetical protein
MKVRKYYDGKYAGTVLVSGTIRGIKQCTKELTGDDIARLAAIKDKERIDFNLRNGEVLTYIGEA